MRKILKRITLGLILALIMIFSISISVNADLVPITKTNGSTIKYLLDGTEVLIPEEYSAPDSYFRAIWVTPKDSSNIGNIKPTKTATKEDKIAIYKKDILRIFDVMEYYNLNVLIFHIRIDNDAIYTSKLNPWSNWFTEYGVDPGWDPLPWIIEECHSRGIEFHAWMNPYRLVAYNIPKTMTVDEYAKTFPSYNIASDPKNILFNDHSSSGTYGAILNPGIQAVRDFIVDTCLEVIKDYDVDAIHFDDYFYATGVNDTSTFEANNPDKLSKADWRRKQVDMFIEQLSIAMRTYCKENNRYVQLGISPSGTWRSAGRDSYVNYDEDGNAVTNGSSTTNSFEHYGDYLYSDTLKWVNEEWIDYILPQTYWALGHTSAAFADLLMWWDKVVKYKNVNLYFGMGIYMSETPGSNYTWGNDPDEAPNEILYASTRENTNGMAFYNYGYLKKAYGGDKTSLYGQGMTTIKNEIFTNPTVLPEVRTWEQVKLLAPTDLSINVTQDGNILKFKGVDEAKFYVVYRSSEKINYTQDQVYKIISSKEDNDGNVTYNDTSADKNYNYGIKTLSKTNTLSDDGINFDMIEFEVVFKDVNGNIIETKKVNYGNNLANVKGPERSGYTFVGWSKDLSFITSSMEVTARYEDSEFTINFYDANGEIALTINAKYGDKITPPTVTKYGYYFSKWDKDYENFTSDLDIYPVFKINKYIVTYYDINGDVLYADEVTHGDKAVLPETPNIPGYNFLGWDKDTSVVIDNMDVYPNYEEIFYTITFVDDIDGTVIATQKVKPGEDAIYPEVPSVEGYEFTSWRGGQTTNITMDRTFTAMYNICFYILKFIDIDGELIEEIEIVYGDEFDTPKIPEIPGKKIIGWDKDLTHVISDLTIKPVYEDIIDDVTFTVTYIGYNDEVLATEIVKSGEDALGITAPKIPEYSFKGWDLSLKNITSDITIKAIYEPIDTTIKFNCENFNLTSVLNLIGLLGFCIVITKTKKHYI